MTRLTTLLASLALLTLGSANANPLSENSRSGNAVSYFELDNGRVIDTHLLQVAKKAGMRIQRVSIDWTDIEQSPRTYSLLDITNTLKQINADGFTPMVSIRAFSRNGTHLPSDLIREELSSKRVTSRFTRMLDNLVPVLRDNDTWLLSIGDDPEKIISRKMVSESDISKLIKATRSFMKERYGNAAIPLTAGMSYSESPKVRDIQKRLAKQLDVTSFEYNGINSDGNVIPNNQISNALDSIMVTSGGKPIVLQTVKVPIAFKGDKKVQAEMVYNILKSMKATPQIKAAFYYAEPDNNLVTMRVVLGWIKLLASTSK